MLSVERSQFQSIKNTNFHIYYIFLKVASLFPYSACLEAIDLCVWITNKQNKRANYKVNVTNKNYKVVLRARNLWLSLRPNPTLYYYIIMLLMPTLYNQLLSYEPTEQNLL